MGSYAQVTVLGDPGLIGAARERIADLEQKWSRFLPTSEVTTANAGAGEPVTVSVDTVEVCRRARTAQVLTGGRFDPLLGQHLAHLGYDRSFEDLRPDAPGPRPPASSVPLEVDAVAQTIAVPASGQLDLGGIGKGYAADVVVGELLAAGAAGALVNLGGDIRVGGAGPTDGAWSVGVEHPVLPGIELRRVLLRDGAVASSGIHRRRWRQDGVERHHLLNPDGTCLDNAIAGVTVLAAEAWFAEVVATDVFVAGEAAALERLSRHGVDGVVVLRGGDVLCTPGMVRAG